MKNFKTISIGHRWLLLGIFAIVLVLPVIVFGEIRTYFNPASGSSQSGACASGQLVNIQNYSAKSYFVPNKTVSEFNSFIAHTPNYIGVSICGDGACTNGETTLSCGIDCPILKGADYCGDGVCSSDGAVVSEDGKNTVTYGETCSNCAIDCGLCKTYTCGPCGEDSNGNMCPNTCDYIDTNTGTTCLKKSTPSIYAADYQSNSDPANYGNLVIIGHWSYLERYDYASASVGGNTVWTCPHTTSQLCPAGYYCPTDGNTNNPHYQCPAGFYCPAGSGKPSFCPPGTYSSAGATSCTLCPGAPTAGSTSAKFVTSGLMSTSSSQCRNLQYCGDGVCDIYFASNDKTFFGGLEAPLGENPISCPQDCQTTPSGSIKGDGRCTGSENYQNDPAECTCGNGTCDHDETATNCQADCHRCGDGICYAAAENHSNCPADCHCGDGTCQSQYGENYSTCPADCHCGDGTCNDGETHGTCATDCLCGDGKCETGSGETISNCSTDCYCGDGICEAGESYGTCRADCKCGNGICDLGENSLNCAADCAKQLKVCGNGICDTGETRNSCPDDCMPSLGVCGNGSCESGETSVNCPADCKGGISDPSVPID